MGEGFSAECLKQSSRLNRHHRPDNAMRCGLYIFSRFDSRRLPGKALRLIAGHPMLGLVIDRARRVRQIDDIIVATSDRSIDDPIAEFAEGEGIAVFRGALDDVAGRALACAEAHDHALFVRISGDSPFFDHVLAGRMVRQAKTGTADIVTNVHPRTFPPGTSIEVIAVEALRRVVAATQDSEHLEHVTQYIYANANCFDIDNVEATDTDYSGVSLVVDTPCDLDRAEWIASESSKTAIADRNSKEIISRARSWTGRKHSCDGHADTGRGAHDY